MCDHVKFLIQFIPMVFAAIAIVCAVRLYREANTRRAFYQAYSRERISLEYMSKLSFGTVLISIVYIIGALHWTLAGAHEEVPEMIDTLWVGIESVFYGFLAQMNHRGLGFISERIEYDVLRSKLRLIEGMVSNAGSYAWQKDANGLYEYCDHGFQQDFFGLDGDECVNGFNDLELIQLYRHRTGKRHDYGNMCVSSDDFARQKGKKCRFVELGFIDNQLFVLDVVKTPIFENGCYKGTVGMAWNMANDIDAVMRNLSTWCEQERLEELCAGAWYVRPRFGLHNNDEPWLGKVPDVCAFKHYLS